MDVDREDIVFMVDCMLNNAFKSHYYISFSSMAVISKHINYLTGNELLKFVYQDIKEHIQSMEDPDALTEFEREECEIWLQFSDYLYQEIKSRVMRGLPMDKSPVPS